MKAEIMSINHKGKPFQLPFIVHQATAVYLYSLLDYEATCKLCERENYKPIIMNTLAGEKKAAGFVIAADYRKTSAVPYLEWVLGVCVISKDRETPELDYINETSLLFQGIMDDVSLGHTVFSPKIIASESLPTEIGYEYYGMPKEVGQINYDHSDGISRFSVATQQGPWIMKASFPVKRKRSLSEKMSLMRSMFKAYNLRLMFQSTMKKEFVSILVGSADILAKNARITSRRDLDMEVFTWSNKDCQLEINPDSNWGKILRDLLFAPALVSYFPNLRFEISEPLDQR
jgi:hypothetical protein